MTQPAKLLKAELREIRWDRRQRAREINSDKTVQVQFNPETLKVSFSNQKAGGDQRGGSAVQFVGAGTTKFSLELWFDVTVPLANGEMQPEGDVRRVTQKVAYFITPRKVGRNKWIPPGVRFLWGTFLFDGVMDSLDENLEFFSEDGKPLRASVSISLSRQEIQFEFGDQEAPAGGESSPGTQPLQPARAGDSVQQMAARAGRPDGWKDIAAANNIENPRQLAPGALLNTDVGGGLTGALGASAGLGVSGGVQAGLGASAGLGVSGGVQAGLGVSGELGGGLGLEASSELSAGGQWEG